MFDDIDINAVKITDASAPQVDNTPAPVVETKSEPTPAPAAQPAAEQTSPVEKTPATPAVETKPVDFESLLVERTKGAYKSWEEIEQKLSAASKTQEIDYVDERIKKLNDYVKANGRFEDWASTQLLNVSEMDAMAAIRTMMKLQKPDLKDEYIDLKLKRQYALDPDSHSEEDVRYAQYELEEKAQEAKNFLKQWQQEHAISPAQKEQAAQEAKIAEWQSYVDEQAKAFTPVIEIALDEKNKFSLGVESKDKVVNVLRNPAEFWNLFTGKDGNVDLKEAYETLSFALNRKAAVSSLAKQYESKGTESVLNEIKNPSHNPVKPLADKPALTELEQIAEAMAAKWKY
jgi:hypothetical protein